MKRILIINNDAFSVVRFRSNLINKLQNHGYLVDIMTPFDPKYSIEVKKLCTNYFTIPMSRWLTPFKDLLLIYEFIKFCIRTRNDYQTIHTMTLKPNLLLAPIASLLYPKRVTKIGLVSGLGDFLYFHLTNKSLVSTLVRNIARLSFKCFKYVWVQNPDDIQLLIDKNILRKSQAVLGFGSGIEPLSQDSFKSLLQNKLNDENPTDRYIFMCVARAIENKGVIDFVEAVRIFNKSMNFKSGIKFILVAPPEDNGVNCLLNVPIPTNIDYISNWITAAQVDDLIKDSYFLCLPSYYPEGVPRFLLEGLRCGVPLITTSSAGCKETVCHEQNGFIVAPKDRYQLAAAFEKAALMTSVEYSRFAKNSFNLAKNKFSTEALWITLSKYLYS